MIVTAKVDNPERYAIARGRHVFLGGVDGQDFSGPRTDFRQVKACSYLNVYDVQGLETANQTEDSEPKNDQSKPDEKANVQPDAKAKTARKSRKDDKDA